MSEPVTLKEAAEVAGVSVKTLRRAIKAGKLPASKVDTSRGEAYTVDIDTVHELFKDGGRRPMVKNPMEGMESELVKLREALEIQLKSSQDREADLSAKIESLEEELHQVSGQLAQMHEQILKALPAPDKKPWWKVWG